MDQQGNPEPPIALDRGDEDAAAWIVGRSASLVAATLDILSVPPPRSVGSGSWHRELADHIRHLLGSLAAALVADDESILVETGEWLGQALSDGGADDHVLAEVWDALGETLRDCPSGWLLLARTAPGYADAEATA